MPDTATTKLPALDEILKDHPGWLDEPVDTPEASRITKFAQSSLDCMRVRGNGPPFIKRGRKILYFRRDLYEWLAAGRRQSTTEWVLFFFLSAHSMSAIFPGA